MTFIHGVEAVHWGRSVFIVATNGEPERILESQYRETALALWATPRDDDRDCPINEWEPGLGRKWHASKYALLALRGKHERLGNDALTDQERDALRRYKRSDFNTFEGLTMLGSARYVALKALIAETGQEFIP